MAITFELFADFDALTSGCTALEEYFMKSSASYTAPSGKHFPNIIYSTEETLVSHLLAATPYNERTLDDSKMGIKITMHAWLTHCCWYYLFFSPSLIVILGTQLFLLMVIWSLAVIMVLRSLNPFQFCNFMDISV